MNDRERLQGMTDALQAQLVPFSGGNHAHPPDGQAPDLSDAELRQRYACLAPKPLKAASRQLPPELIRGLLYQGRRFIVTGESKSKKSWFLHQLLYCIANGLDFLGFSTSAAVVLYVNLELLEAVSALRFDAIGKAIGKGDQARLHVISAAEYLDRIDADFPRFLALSAQALAAALVAIDPIWRLLLGRSENDNSDVARLMAPMVAFARDAKASMGFAHHHAKGPAGLKEAIDRASGAGAFMRDPALIVTMTPHREEDAFVLNFKTSDFPHVPPFVVRFEYPLFVRDDSLNPEDLRALPGKKAKDDPKLEQMLSALRATDAEGGLTHAAWKKAAGLAKTTFNRKLAELTRKGGPVVKSVATDRYMLSPAYAEGLRDGEDP